MDNLKNIKSPPHSNKWNILYYKLIVIYYGRQLTILEISAKANFDFISKYKIYFCNVIIRILLHTVKWKRGRGEGRHQCHICIHQSVLAVWCGKYHASHLDFPGDHLLAPNLNWVSLGAQVNFSAPAQWDTEPMIIEAASEHNSHCATMNPVTDYIAI